MVQPSTHSGCTSCVQPAFRESFFKQIVKEKKMQRNTKIELHCVNKFCCFYFILQTIKGRKNEEDEVYKAGHKGVGDCKPK